MRAVVVASPGQTAMFNKSEDVACCASWFTASRAVGAGPAGPAAVGPIFGRLTRAKMPYELWWVVQLLL